MTCVQRIDCICLGSCAYWERFHFCLSAILLLFANENVGFDSADIAAEGVGLVDDANAILANGLLLGLAVVDGMVDVGCGASVVDAKGLVDTGGCREVVAAAPANFRLLKLMYEENQVMSSYIHNDTT